MLCNCMLILEISEIRLRVFLKFFEIFLKKCQKFVKVRLGISQRAENFQKCPLR
jgi:hypothetical protein